MAKFRKKPVVIEAMQFTGGPDSANDIFKWSDITMVYSANSDTLSIETLEGTMTAQVGDWIIKGVQGEFYPCKPDIFRETYEPVEGAGKVDSGYPPRLATEEYLRKMEDDSG